MKGKKTDDELPEDILGSRKRDSDIFNNASKLFNFCSPSKINIDDESDDDDDNQELIEDDSEETVTSNATPLESDPLTGAKKSCAPPSLEKEAVEVKSRELGIPTTAAAEKKDSTNQSNFDTPLRNLSIVGYALIAFVFILTAFLVTNANTNNAKLPEMFKFKEATDPPSFIKLHTKPSSASLKNQEEEEAEERVESATEQEDTAEDEEEKEEQACLMDMDGGDTSCLNDGEEQDVENTPQKEAHHDGSEEDNDHEDIVPK